VKKLFALGLLTALVSTSAWAQLPPIVVSTQPYTPLVGAITGTPVIRPGSTFDAEDEGFVAITLPFTFTYLGQNYTQVFADTNGFVSLGAACTTGCLSPTAFPNSAAPNGLITGMWEDMEVDALASIRYQTSPSEVVIEWTNVVEYFGSGRVTFQIKLTAGGSVVLHMGPITTGFTGTVGFENGAGTVGANLIAGCTSSCTSANWVPNRVYTIGEPNEADLAVSTVTIANFVTAGDGNLSFDLSATLRNFGRTSASGFFWRAFISRDQVLDTTATDGGADIQVASGGPEALPAVDGGVTADGGQAIVLVTSAAVTTTPPAQGEYFVLVEVDSTNVVTEASEVNNIGSTLTSFVQGIDLVATSISGPAATGGGNAENFPVSFFNRGTTPAGSVGFRILLSVDQVLDPSDYTVFTGTRTVSGGATITETVPVTLPAGVPNGTFYWLLQIDPTSAITEANEMNNVAASAGTVNVQRADLVNERVSFLDTVTGLETTRARFGEAVQMKVRLKNQGGANANNFRVAFVLSTDSSLSLLSDTYVCDQLVAQVTPSAPTSTEVTLNCMLPLANASSVAFTTGLYYVFGAVDSTGAVFETNKANNSQMLGPIRITAPGPDLAVSAVTAPASAGVGEVLPVVRTLANLGNVDAPAVTYRFYASANEIITPDDVLLPIVGNGSDTTEGAVTLARGQVNTATELVRLPGSMPAGTYYVGCIVDTGGVVTADLEPSNNALASRSMVIAPSSLRVVNTSLPDAVVGRPFSFRLSAIGEQGPSTWRIDPALGGPSAGWLRIDAATGLLSGTPMGSDGVGAFGVTVVLENANRQAAIRLAVRVLPTASGLEITSTSLPAVVNSSTSLYQFALGAAGGVRPYTWRVATGTLPTGVVLGPDGVLAGAPRNATNGAMPITFEVRDSVGGRVQRQLSLRLIAPGAITFRTIAIPDALVGQEYLQDIAVANQDGSGLAKPLTWRVTGALPNGLQATPQSELITVAGRATEAGTFSFNISVEDNNGRIDSLEFTMTVHPPRYRVLGTLPEVLRPGAEVSVPLSVSPNGTVTYRVVNGALPPGLTLEPSGVITGTVAGDGAEGAWPFIVEVEDAAGMTGLTALSLRVEREARSVGCSSTAADWSPLAALAVVGLFLRRRRAQFATAAALALALVPVAARAQIYDVVGPMTAAYQPLANGAVTTAGAAITVPFSVPFFDRQITTVAMSQYGYLAIGGSAASSSTNLTVPHTSTSSTAPTTFLAAWWDTMVAPATPANGYRYQISGVAPYRVMAFEWNAVGAPTATNRISFQVLLYETTGRIRYVYSTALPGTSSASVGIQKENGTGFPGMSCASNTSYCSSSAYPAGQAIDFFLPPDFEITALSAPQTGYTGVAFPQTATVRNRGGRDVQNVAVRFYLSTDATLDPMVDTRIGSMDAVIPSLPAGATQQATLNAPLPMTLTQSSYFVFAVVDPDRLVVETSDNNNTSAPSTVTIGTPTADLVVASFSAPTTAMPGATLQVSRSFQNLGNAASTAAKFSYFLSDNASVSIADRSLSVGNLGALNPQQVDMGMDSVALPAELSPGLYWLGVCVNYDAGTSSFGGNEITIVNNCFTQVASVQVSTGAVSIVTTPLPMATQYSPYGLRLQATGGNGMYTWELAGGALPAGMSLSTSGDLVGSPSSAGAFSFDAKVTSGMLTDTRALSITVQQGGLPLVIVDQTLTAAEFGRSYSASLVAVGGKPPYRWRALDPEELPPGLGIATDGLLEGRPVTAGDYAFAVEVKDSTDATVSKELSLRVVTPTSLAIATTAVETASLGRAYLQPLVAIGGRGPYAWSLIRFQELPENLTDAPGPAVFDNGNPVAFPENFGLAIEDTDTADFLSGTPARAGLFQLTLKVVDGAMTEDTASVLLRVSYRDGLAITTLQLPDAFVNQPYQVRLSHNGGSDAVGITFSTPCVQQAVRPGEFACAASEALQKLPVGLQLNADGAILGTPNADTGTYTFLVKVADANGRQDVRALALRLRPDFSLERSGCSAVGLQPSLLALALAGFALRRRRR
jgi:subtilase family serine protease